MRSARQRGESGRCASRTTASTPLARGLVAKGLIGLATAALAVAVAPTASASPAVVPNDNGASPHSASSGGRSGSFDDDNSQDLLARSATTGVLKVYPHSGTYSGTTTFRAAQQILGDSRTFRWIGQGDFNGDGFADVAGITRADGRMLIALNRGGLNGTNTLDTGVTVGYGWNSTDLVFTGDVDGDGRDDVLARKKGTTSTYAYLNSTPRGQTTPKFGSAQLLAQTTSGVIDQKLVDITGDGLADLVSIKSNGQVHMRDYSVGPTRPDGSHDGISYLIGTGYNALNAVVANDVDVDNKVDLLGRRASDGVLLAYMNNGWNPAAPLATFDAPRVIGYGWNSNDVIS